MKIPAVLLGLVVLCATANPALAQEARWPAKTLYRSTEVHGHRMFYREAGATGHPTVLLLHGYPSSSHAYRELIPLLSGRYHVIAPDNLGSGYSDKPDPSKLPYSFDLLARQISGLLIELELRDIVIYMQDFGAPVGFRVMLAHPDRIRAVVSQNGNAYLEGIPEAKQDFFRNAAADRSPAAVAALFDFTSAKAIQHQQYLRDVADRPEVMNPDSWSIDAHHLETELQRRIQVQLFQDYSGNLDAYPAWQAFMRERQLPTLLVWGANDPVFTPAGARAFLRDVPAAQLRLLDAGHFAVEEKPVEIAQAMISFIESLPRNAARPQRTPTPHANQ